MSYSIELPKDLSDQLWIEYSNLNWGVDGRFKGFREYISYKIPNANITGKITEGYRISFNEEKDLTWFLLRWS